MVSKKDQKRGERGRKEIRLWEKKLSKRAGEKGGTKKEKRQQ